MLPDELKPKTQWTISATEWEKYYASLKPEYKSLDKDFLRQICFEHFDRFNGCFPGFDLSKSKIDRVKIPAEQLGDIRYDENAEVDFWDWHMTDYFIEKDTRRYSSSPVPVMRMCIDDLTWPFPPVIISNEVGRRLGGVNLGEPWHLIEGTHRVCYISWMYRKNMINPKSQHEVIFIS